MPVVESYPSIVGIAQVAQAAGQGRYNQWLAEYNARSNQMKTNALMSGFQTGSSLGMSIGNMWQQQAQFAQRQGFIESQAAQTLQKDTEFTQAMIPALDPLVQQMYPHLNEEQRGAYIGSLDRRQVDAMVNNLGNASRAKAAYDQFGSPHAIRKQAKATYDKMVTGQKHHNARVQARLEPLFQRMRDNDLGLNEGAVQREIAQILREEGEAKGGLSKQEQADLNTFEVRDDNGNLLEKVVEMQPGKYIQVKVPQPKTTGTRRTGTGDDSPDEIERAVRDEWKHQSSVWESQYGKESAHEYDFDRSLIGTLTDDDGIHYRRLTPEELTSARKHGFGKSALGQKVREHNGEFYLPTPIPPRPTMKQARRAVMSRRGIDTKPTGGPVHKLVFPHEWSAVQGAQGGTPQPRAAQQPGQTMPQVPRPRRPDLIQPRVPSPGGMAEYGAAGIDERGRVRPGEMLQQQDIDLARSSELRAQKAKVKAKNITIQKLRKDHGNAAQVGLTKLIGTENSPPTPITAQFEDHVRKGGDPSDFGQTLLIEEEKKELEKAIPKFGAKLGAWDKELRGGGARGGPGIYTGFDEPEDWRIRARRNLKKADKNAYYNIEKAFRLKREFVTRLAAEAVRSTPPGQRPDVANIPSYTMGQFDLAVQRGQMRVGTMIMTSQGVKPVTTRDLRDAQDRIYQQRTAP